MSVNEKIRLVSERFKQRNVDVDNDWLSGCVQFFCEETPSATIDQLYEQADEQWQLSDLGDSGCPCLPNSIFTEKQSHMITGTFPLQLQYLIDIAESAYDQLQKMYNKQLDEGKEQQEFKQTQATAQQRNSTKAKRVLKLELFDGRRSVTAMEYRPISCLNTKLTPGTKVLLSGPIRCVNHVLLLEAKSIRLLGGEVGTLSIQNAFENVLLRKLNRPLNPNPKTNYTEDSVVVENGVVERPILPRIPMSQTQSTANVGDILDDDFGDELLLAIDSDQLPLPQPQQQHHHHQPHDVLNENDSFGELDENAFMQIDELTRSGAVVTTSINEPATAHPSTHNTNRLSTDPIVIPPQNKSICDETYAFKIRGINLAFIWQLRACVETDKLRRRYFMVKARVVDVTDNAHVKRNQWSLGVILDDGINDSEIEVRFHNDVLEKLTGVTATEVHRMNAARKTRPHVDEDLTKILDNLTQRLQNIHSYMKIEFIGESECPVVLEIIEPAPVLEQKYQEKLRKEIS